MSKHFPPAFHEQKFHCPFCDVYAVQRWANVTATIPKGMGWAAEDVEFCKCTGCEKDSIWHSQRMIYPDSGSAPLPHEDMPDNVKVDFNEARGIVAKSPRGAAALLRLAMQKLMIDLGESGETPNVDIGNLVKKGLPVQIQQACDSVRVIGNNAVHPGELNLNDTPELAHRLFDLLNIIVQVMISQPKQIEAIYDSLPESSLNSIDKRDKKP
jgi:hypothetical protein